jgi:hypothetical protein
LGYSLILPSSVFGVVHEERWCKMGTADYDYKRKRATACKSPMLRTRSTQGRNRFPVLKREDPEGEASPEISTTNRRNDSRTAQTPMGMGALGGR